LIALIANARRSVRLLRSRKLSLPRPAQNVPIRLGSLRVQPLKTEAGLALDFSKRPVLLQTHPGTLAVKLGSRLDSDDSRDMRQTTGLAACVLSPRPFDRMRFLFTMSDSHRPSA